MHSDYYYGPMITIGRPVKHSPWREKVNKTIVWWNL